MAQGRGLQVAMEAAQRQRDIAMQRLAQKRQARQLGQQQLDQLTGYATETEQRSMLRGQIGTSPEVIQHHLQFMARLEQTIELQKSQMATLDEASQEAERQLLVAELRLVSLRQVVQRRERDAAQSQLRREQKEVDEMAASRYRLLTQATA